MSRRGNQAPTVPPCRSPLRNIRDRRPADAGGRWVNPTGCARLPEDRVRPVFPLGWWTLVPQSVVEAAEQPPVLLGGGTPLGPGHQWSAWHRQPVTSQKGCRHSRSRNSTGAAGSHGEEPAGRPDLDTALGPHDGTLPDTQPSRAIRRARRAPGRSLLPARTPGRQRRPVHEDGEEGRGAEHLSRRAPIVSPSRRGHRPGAAPASG